MKHTLAQIHAVVPVTEIAPQKDCDPSRVFYFTRYPGIGDMARTLGVGEYALTSVSRSDREDGATKLLRRWLFSAAEVETIRALIVERRKATYRRSYSSWRKDDAAKVKREAKKRPVSQRLLDFIEESAQRRFAELGRTIDEHRVWARAAVLGEQPRQQVSDPDAVRLDRDWVRREVSVMATRRTGAVASERCDATSVRITQAESRRMRVPGAPVDPCFVRGKGAQR
jgi:hypothetical protein